MIVFVKYMLHLASLGPVSPWSGVHHACDFGIVNSCGDGGSCADAAFAAALVVNSLDTFFFPHAGSNRKRKSGSCGSTILLPCDNSHDMCVAATQFR